MLTPHEAISILRTLEDVLPEGFLRDLDIHGATLPGGHQNMADAITDVRFTLQELSAQQEASPFPQEDEGSWGEYKAQRKMLQEQMDAHRQAMGWDRP